jgi:hypothetical protein
MAYDKTYSALFNPGAATDLFGSHQHIPFEPLLCAYSNANAWWLAELCRLVYKIDDQQHQPSQEVVKLLDDIGWLLKDIITDSGTSTCAVVFESPAAISGEHKPIRVVVFCGSNEALDWKMNLQAGQTNLSGLGRVHQGFLSSVRSISSELLSVLGSGTAPVILAGHSLGGALATLMAFEIQQQISISACYSFGCPRVGDKQFVEALASMPFYRIVNNCDPVTSIPISLGPYEYLHPDEAIFLDQTGGFETGLSDVNIQQRQAETIPALKRYLDLQQLMTRIKSLSTDLPEYFADHAIVNYSTRISNQLGL